MNSERPRSSVQRYFSGLTEYTFHTSLGVADVRLIDYVADMLTRFVHSESVFRIRKLNGQQLICIVDMLEEANARIGQAKREAYRHIGDFLLFFSGMYPEALKHLRQKQEKDQLIDYQVEAVRSYYVASKINQVQEDEQESEVLERISEQFSMCAYGLSEIRRQWQATDGEDSVGIIWFN